jgi:hypothetical protein
MESQNWSRFYTPHAMAETIVDAISPHFTPKTIIDICVGSGNMLARARQKWPDAFLIGVDLVLSNELSTTAWQNLTLHEFNALEYDRITRLSLPEGNLLVLANPPFGFSKSRPLLNNSSLSQLNYLAIKSGRMEALMIISNLLLLKVGDWFGAVLPENIFTSEKLKEFRNLFLEHFDNANIGKSKLGFKSSEVNTRTFVGRYIGPVIREKKQVRYSKILITNSLKEQFPLIRGIDNTKLIHRQVSTTNDKEVLHFNNSNKINVMFLQNSLHDYKYQTVYPDDLIIVRVGRNAGTIVIPDEKSIGKLISDHLIIIRNGRSLPFDNIKRIMDSIIRKNKGLTTKYIAKQDIWESIYFSLTSPAKSSAA